MDGTDIAILAVEGVVGIGSLAGIIIFLLKIKNIRKQSIAKHEQIQKNALDEMLKNNRRG